MAPGLEKTEADVIVAGHLALDIFPALLPDADPAGLLAPGTLTEAGPLQFAPGGCVANTGLALHRLGVSVGLAARVGGDETGRLVRARIAAECPGLAEHLRETAEAGSYTLVFSTPRTDRSFLHFPGPNASFRAADVDWERWPEARFFHFGYPPLMRGMYSDDGEQLAELMRGAKAAGLTTTLDMAMPDSESVALGVDWRTVLGRALPYVDLFLPGYEEMRLMLGAPDEDAQSAAYAPERVAALAEELLALGCRAVALKLGQAGLYLRTSERASAPGFPGGGWQNRELWAPCFSVTAAGTTGAGDCTIAGFLAGLSKGLPPEAVMTGAVAAGACSVERTDALGGIVHWDAMLRRIEAGWPSRRLDLGDKGWRRDEGKRIWSGPADAGRLIEGKE